MASSVRQMDRVPLVTDDARRVVRLAIDADLNVSSFNSAFVSLRKMVEARGYHGIEVSDVQLFVPFTLEAVGRTIKATHGIKAPLVLVPPEMLKSNFTWEIRSGLDSVLSVPLD